VAVHCSIQKSSYNISNITYLNSASLSFSFISPSSHSWNSFNRSYFSIYIYVYTVVAAYTPSIIISSHPPSSHWYQSPRQVLFHPPILWFCVKKGEEKNSILDCLRQLHQEFPCGTSMFVCIITQFGSSPLFFFFLSHSLSHSGFNWFTNSIMNIFYYRILSLSLSQYLTNYFENRIAVSCHILFL
jgi:hypothetical protein